MNENPLLNKMDALLKKHRGSGQTESIPATAPAVPAKAAPPPGAWLPVLTDVIERGTPPPVGARPAVQPPPSTAPAAAVPAAPISAEPRAAAVAETIVDDALAKQLMSELAPKLSEAMEKQVAAELRKNLDHTVASLLSQLDVNVHEIVRDAVAEKLKKQGALPN